MNLEKILIFFIFMTSQITADEIEKRQRIYFIEATGGISLFIPNNNLHRIDSNIMNKNNDFNNRQEVIGDNTLKYGSDEQKIASVYVFENSPKPKLKSRNYSIFYEYIFYPKIGLGVSLNRADFEAQNISSTKQTNNFIVNTANYTELERRNFVNEEILIPNNTRSNKEFLQLYTLGVHLSYHFLNDPIFDPYIRFGFGYGRNYYDMAIIYQSSFSIGSRFFTSEDSYFLIEISANNYDAYKIPDSSLFQDRKSDLRHIWSIQEISGKIGIGLIM